MTVPTIDHNIREVGSNAQPDGNAVTHVDMTKGLASRLIKTFWPGKENEPPALSAPPAPPVDPAIELPRQRELLVHLIEQRDSAKASLENLPRSMFTGVADCASRQRQYAEMLVELRDLASEPWIDLPLLLEMLERPGENLIFSTQLRIAQLDEQLRKPASPTEEHARLVSSAEKALRQFGKAYIALRKHEKQNVGMRLAHDFRAPRRAIGFEFGRVDAATLARVAEFAATIPDSK